MLHNTQNIRREQNTGKKENKTAYLLSRQCGFFTTSRGFGWRYCSWVSGFQDIRGDSDRSLGYALRKKNMLIYGARVPSLEYKHTNEHRPRIPVFERIRLEFQ